MHTAGKFGQAFSSTSDQAQILGRLLVKLSKLRMKFEPFLTTAVYLLLHSCYQETVTASN